MANMRQRNHHPQELEAAGASILGTAPFRSSEMTVEDAWIDYNGHLNMAYYHVLFDRAVDEMFDRLGIGKDYVRTRNLTIFALESHTAFLRELTAGARVVIDIQILGHDAKRLHFFETMVAVEGGFVAATCEQASIHIDLATRRSAPIPEDVMPRIASAAAAHATLPRPEQAGRSIGLVKRPP
jgi:acyl-CoA thioester hydrolase